MGRTLEFVLERSSEGHHVLFDSELVRRSFEDGARVDKTIVDGACALLDGLREVPDLAAQRTWIAGQPEDVKRLFVRLYFDYLAGFMSRRGIVYH
ncbi:MAG: hypothetical protein IT385_08415 [Deltaproteobacteria bacterium]|nr:hypothetical protein [Deltaproteobacteria bacterium]